MPFEVTRVPAETLESFYTQRERESLRAFYEFPVIWHEARYGFAVKEADAIVAAGTLKVAASLGEIERLVVDAEHRRRGYARAIVNEMADVANYYNCHKMTVMVPHLRSAQRFFEACGYGVEAVLPQHTFKLDMALMRKYLL
ncbi:MAG TPA: GNAT family N-acetyltransferase [Candidatus Aquilonibacter sp.]|nr:GNAT family N-acetyltransferase [Candidatus Aquilonibacter sp.]